MDEYEDRARSLLTLAAETIPVSAGPISVVRPRPVWPWLAAAAVVLAVLAPVALLGGGREVSPQPDPVPSTMVVPQTIWMTEAQAREALSDAGLEIEVRVERQCDLAGRVLGSWPRPGTFVDPGDRVRVTVAGSESGSVNVCSSRQAEAVALSMLDFARFGTGDLEFATHVSLYVDGRLTRRLSAEEAASPEAWGDPSPLSRLLDAIDSAQRANPRSTPAIDALVDPPRYRYCGKPDPIAGRRVFLVRVAALVDGVAACHEVLVYRNAGGRIAAVASEDRTPSGTLIVD